MSDPADAFTLPVVDIESVMRMLDPTRHVYTHTFHADLQAIRRGLNPDNYTHTPGAGSLTLQMDEHGNWHVDYQPGDDA